MWKKTKPLWQSNKLTTIYQPKFLLLDDGTGVPADASTGVHKAGNDPAGSTIPFDPPAAADPPAADASSDHSDAESRELLVTTSFSMSARELQRVPRPWVDPAAGLEAASEETASLGGWDAHGRPGTNSLISSTDDAALPTLQTKHPSSLHIYNNSLHFNLADVLVWVYLFTTEVVHKHTHK